MVLEMGLGLGRVTMKVTFLIDQSSLENFQFYTCLSLIPPQEKCTVL